MRNTLIDAGPLIALFDSDDKHHTKVLEYIKSYRGSLVSTWPALTEVTHMLGYNLNVQLDFLKWVESGGVEVATIHIHHLDRVRQIMDTYSDLPADFADSTLLVVAEEMLIKEIITLDSDFSVLKTAGGQLLENILLK